MLFSGDHVMNGSTVVIAPLDGNMTEYLDQLERLLTLGLRSIAPGHGPLITDPDAKLAEYLDHRRAREKQIAAALGSEPRTVDDIVAAVYVDLVDALRPVARYSVWAHLRRLAQCERALTGDVDDVTSAWTAPRT